MEKKEFWRLIENYDEFDRSEWLIIEEESIVKDSKQFHFYNLEIGKKTNI